MAERVEDLNLPNSVVTRIIKECLPQGVNVSKEARTAIARAASVFVLYLTSSSNTVSMQANRKTISGNDVLKALEETEFDMFIDSLRGSLEAFKKSQVEKKQKAMVSKKVNDSNQTHVEDESEIIDLVDGPEDEGENGVVVEVSDEEVEES